MPPPRTVSSTPETRYPSRNVRYCDLSFDEWKVQDDWYKVDDFPPLTWCVVSCALIVVLHSLLLVSLILLVPAPSMQGQLLLLSTDLGHVPDVSNASSASGRGLYWLADGQAGFNLLNYVESDTIVDESDPSYVTSFTSWYATSISFSCHYSVYSNITGFQALGPGKDYQPIGQLSEQLLVPGCAAWQVAFGSFIAFWVLWFFSCFAYAFCVFLMLGLRLNSSELRRAIQQRRDGNEDDYSTPRVWPVDERNNNDSAAADLPVPHEPHPPRAPMPSIENMVRFFLREQRQLQKLRLQRGLWWCIVVMVVITTCCGVVAVASCVALVHHDSFVDARVGGLLWLWVSMLIAYAGIMCGLLWSVRRSLAEEQQFVSSNGDVGDIDELLNSERENFRLF